MSELDSIFGDGWVPVEDHFSQSEVPQTRIRPSIHNVSRTPMSRTKNEVEELDRTPKIDFGAFGNDHVLGHSTAENHEDYMVVDQDENPMEAGENWSQDPNTKFESDPQAATIANPIAAQRVMMERFRNQHQNGAKCSGQDQAVLSSSASRSRKTKSYNPVVIEAEDMEDLHRNMRYHDDDHKWMDADAGTGDEDELVNLSKMSDSLKQRQRLKRLSKTETIQLAKLDEKIEIRNRRERIAQRKETARHEEMAGQSMFISDEDDLNAGASDEEEFRNQQSTNLQDAEIIANSSTASIANAQIAQAIRQDSIGNGVGSNKKAAMKSTKRRRPVAKTAREVEEHRREKALEKENKKRARDSISKLNSKGKGKKAKLGKVIAKREKKQYQSRMKNTWKGAGGGSDETLQTLFENLVANNFIADRQNQGDFGDAPDINERSKDRQLEALQASAPDDYDTHKLKTDKSDLMQASRRFGRGKVSAYNGKWLLKGMTSSLYHHQLLAADWMVTRELGTTGPFGGLLADAMGMGKTVETLATMVGNPPSKDHIRDKVKATLLVLPSSAIKQWRDEISTHVGVKVFPMVVHYAAKKEISLTALREFDIVLTSYTEVMKSFPYPSKEDLKTFGNTGGHSRWMEECKKNTGDLHKIEWYRIVLDESHAIKNFKSRTSLACQNLRGKYRWALSGTPIQNRLDELFPYFRFLRAPWTNDYSEFRDHFCDPDADDANARISVVLSIVMLRRTMKDEILGRPIVELPQIYPETNFISFSREEKVIYRVLEECFRENLNQHFASGTAQRNYSIFMVQLLRLRQCTSHPFLLENTIKEALGPSDLMRLKTGLKKLSRHSKPIYEQISQWVEETEEERAAAHDRGEPTSVPGQKTRFGKSEFGRFFRMEKYLESIAITDVAGRMVCKLCGDHPTDPYFLDCHHCYCCECLRNYMASEGERDGDREFYECPQADCRKFFAEGQTFKEALEEVDKETRSESGSETTPEGDVSFGQSEWFSMCMNDPKKYLLPSAKTIALKSQILKWLDQAPSDKILIFTQFRLLVKIIALICNREGWGNVSFTGDMSQDQRYEAIKTFHEDPSIKIMIAGLKCGGQALNLTCANRVISIDLWWNHSVEQQAFGRVFRIGQKKETYVSRFVVKGSVDQRLLSMQADKVLTIDKAMQDTGYCTPTLSMEELASLFGHLSQEEDGTLHVVPDYSDDEDDEDDKMEDRAERSDDDA